MSLPHTTTSTYQLPNNTNKPESQAVSPENFNEAIFLLCIACIGLSSNIAVVVCILSRRHLRKTASAFVIHECVLDAVRCLYCFPFAVSLLWDMAPGFCAALGGSYVVVVTASSFNIVAMVCCEAYVFGERNLAMVDQGFNGTDNHQGSNEQSNICCVVFGVLMVHAASMIIHLGPTIIGGDFSYNDLIGNCIFMYGSIKSYVAQAMWIVIITLSMLGTVYYLTYFHRHIQDSTRKRLSSLYRASLFIDHTALFPDEEFDTLTTPIFTTSASDITTAAYKEQFIRSCLQKTLSRCRVLIIITSVFIVSWYPLYILTLVDPKFQQPSKIYKLLTFIAWSNAAINPFIFVLFDRQITFNSRCSIRSVPSFMEGSRSNDIQMGISKTNSRPLSQPEQRRIGNRLFQEGFKGVSDQRVMGQCNGSRQERINFEADFVNLII